MTDYLSKVRQQPCLICGGAQGDSDAHHLRFMGGRGMGKKAHNKWATPLCRIHHDENHMWGKEIDFWIALSINPVEWCKNFWKEHGNEKALEE